MAAQTPSPSGAKPDASAGAKPASAAASADSSSSIALQLASVRKQAGISLDSPGAIQDPFFTVPWPTPPPLPGMGSADCDPMPIKDLTQMVANEAQKQGVKAELIQAVIDQESGGKPCAVSDKGAMGLMQLMPDKAAELSVNDPYDPGQNVAGGVKFLKELLDKYHGDTSLALSAYNAGEQRVDQTGGVPQIPETKNYVDSIQNKLDKSTNADTKKP